MKRLSLGCVVLLAGCSLLEPRRTEPERLFAHPYRSLPRTAGEIKNLNPDSDGAAWIAGGLVLPSDRELESVPVVSLSGTLAGVGELPGHVDNSKKKYFRGIFAQKHGSCAQASGIAYVYGYEVNRIRGLDSSDPSHRYPTHWTYNFVNNGYDRGSWMMWGWEVGKSLGIPDAKTYGTETGFDLKHWPSDYNVYEAAIDNKVERYFVMSIATKSRLEGVKRFLWNHGAEGREGGIVSFAAGWSTGYTEAHIPEGQHGAGKKLIKSFGEVVNHAVTFVGYDDEICFDFDGDGECRNDRDLNDDGKVDVRDWEVGSFIMANSWGTQWGNDGFIYVPYRLGALKSSDGGIYRQSVYGVVPKTDQDKTLVLRVTMQHDKRDELKLLGSYRKDDKQEKRTSYYRYYGLQSSGGPNPLNGKDGGAVTFGLDLRPLLRHDNLKSGLHIGSVVDSIGRGVGKIVEVAVVDYVDENVYPADARDVDIVKGRNAIEAWWDRDGEPDPDPDPDPEPPEPCRIGPVAKAGDDVMVGEYCTLILDASDSYDGDDGKIVKYLWRQRSGPQRLKIENADTPKALVLIPTVKSSERYTFVVLVADDDGFTDSDIVRVTVRDRF